MEDGELSETAKNIVNQAQNWSFEGDCLLLHWMEQISQNLESRAKTTTEALDKVAKNLVRGQIALENTQNGLNALQFTQYVEMRCQEDELPIEPENTKDETEEKPKKDILKVFLQNNLNMLHNCHDKFNFMEDSEEEEIDNSASADNCIYQPRNPYNERLLPHIYGTKMWKENWHIGLCEEGEQNYSGDETSDVYSSSSSSCGEHESIESHNTENLSQWTSSVSLNNDSVSINNKVGNFMPPSTSKASSLTLDLPVTQIMHIPQPKHPIMEMAKNMEEEKISSNESLEPAIPTGTVNKKSLQCKTLNLFDDNDFKSLMSEITDKAQAKKDIHHSQGTVPAYKERVSAEEPKRSIFASRSNSPVAAKPLPTMIATNALPKPNKTSQKISAVNLFDSPTDDFLPVENFEQPNTNSKMDLFEGLENVNSNRPTFLTDAALKTPPKIQNKTMISAKSLFENDDGDKDFLNIFGKPKSSVRSEKNVNIEQLSTAAIFDDNDFNFSNKKVKEVPEESSRRDDEMLAQQAAVSKINTVPEKKSISTNIFLDDSEDDENDFIFAKANQNETTKKVKNISASPKQDIFEKQASLFDDFDDGDIFDKIPSAAPRTIGVVDGESSKPIPAFMAVDPPEDNREQHEKPNPIIIDQAKKLVAADNNAVYMAEEPPEDIEEQREQPLITTKSKEISIESDDDDDFFILLANSKSKLKTKTSIFDSANLKESENTTKTPVENITSVEEDLSLGIKPTELRAESSRGTENTNSSSNDNNVALKTNSLVNEVSLTSNEISHGEKELKVARGTQEIATEKTKNEGGDNVEFDIQPNKEIVQPVLKDKPAELEKDETISKGASEDALHTPDISNSFKPVAYDYSPLFLDEPPDDDFFQVISGNVNVTQSNLDHDFFEPTTSQQKVTETKTEDSTHLQATYGIGLFSEVPPEDEESTNNFLQPVSRNAAPELPKQQQEDNDTSKVATNLDLTPPVDIFAKMAIKEKDERDHQAISKPKSVLAKLTPPKDKSIDIPPKTTVSKLKMPSININVQALLPNAVGKPKIDNRNASVNTEDNIPPLVEIPKSTKTEILAKDVPLEAGRENLLPSLCKNRVRGPLKRRASTRAGRQESYRKTLENEQKMQNEEQNAKKDENVQRKTKSPFTLPALNDQSWIDEKSSHADAESNHSNHLEAPNRPSSATNLKPASHQKASTKPQKSAGSNIFEEFDGAEDNDDFLSSLKTHVAEKVDQKSYANAQKSLTINASQGKEQTASIKSQKGVGSNLFKEFDEAEDNDDFLDILKPKGAEKVEQKSNTNAQKSLPINPSQAKEQTAPEKPQMSVGSNLFKEFDEAEDNDDFLSSLKPHVAEKVEQKSNTNAQKSLPINPSQAKEQTAPEKPQMSVESNLFKEFDEAEDNDDFLSSLKPHVAEKVEQKSNANAPKSSPHQQKQKGAGSNLFKELDNDDDSQSNVKQQSVEKLENNSLLNAQNPSPITLESDDDLFAQSNAAVQNPIKKVTPQPTSRPKNATQSKKLDALFGSDSNDDEEDDLFRTLSMPKVPVKVLSSSSKEAKDNNKSLFSDNEDDDDDLFGNSAAKTKKTDSVLKTAAAVKKNTINPQPLTEKTKAPAPTTSDNPLADLLNS